MIIEPKDIRALFYRGPALVFGPGATAYPTVDEDCLATLQREYPEQAKVIRETHYYDFAEVIAAQQPPSRKDVRKIISTFFQKIQPNPQLERMVTSRWTAAVSLTADGHFADALRNYFDKKPLGWTATKVLDPRTILDPKSVPVYELLGDVNAIDSECQLAVLRSEYLTKRRNWSKILRSFPDFVKGDPVLFVGTSSIVSLVCDFINELLSLGSVVPRRLIFLAEDPTALNPRFLGLVKGICQVDTINCSLAEFCEATSHSSLAISIKIDHTSANQSFDPTKLYSVSDQICVVPSKFAEYPIAQQKHRLLDILFSPTNLDWSPYSAGLDFKREIAERIEKTINGRFERNPEMSNPCIVVKGEAGTGKTVLLRRIAFDFALAGYLSIWVRTGYGVTPGTRFEAVVKAIESAVHSSKTRVLFFLDDALGGRRSPREILLALSHAKFEWVLIFGLRNSDLAQQEDHAFYLTKCETFEVPNDFGPDEASRLPEYLVSLDAAKDRVEATRFINSLSQRDPQGNLFGNPSDSLFRDGKDILCMLWYLLPQTRAAISDSLTNEYLRLGGIAGALRQYADASTDGFGVERLAYELVTTTSGIGTPLPVEVLVATLGVSYEAWLDMCSEKKPLWGLLYSEPYPEADTYGFRTRNHVVTKVLLSILNGGSPGHAGEFRCLKRIVASCTSGAIQYREFLCDVLVRRKRHLELNLTYEQGLELYDLARNSFPLPDRTIAHHRALWIKDVGNLPLEAYEALQEVQRTPVYPHANRPEPLEHIHTSMAACALQAVSQRRIELLPGVELVHQHVAQASTPNFFDLYSEHLNARTLLKLATHVRNSDQQQFIACLEEATRIIDRAILIIDPLPEHRLELTGASRMFSDLRAEIAIAFNDSDEAKSAAFELFKRTKNQMGFVLAARLLIGNAKERDKGSLFKKAQDFVNEAISFIEKENVGVLPDLFLIRAELVIVWRLLPQKADLNWECLKGDLKVAVSSPQFSRDPIWLFYLAVAHFHLNEISMADAIFTALRQLNMSSILRSPSRCFYIGPDGAPRTLQGKMESGGRMNRFIQCPELGTDIMARKGEFSQSDDATVHFHVVFSLLGPLAVSHTTTDIRRLDR